MDATGRPLEASNWAETYRRNGLLAAGENLPIATPGGGVSRGTGTSYATAIVSGVAALLLSVAERERYDIEPRDIRDILIDSAAPCTLPGDGACDRYLAGTLDAAAALAMLHRIGRAGRPATAPGPAEGGFRLTQRLEQSANFGMGSMVMSNSGSVESVVAATAPAVEPSAVAPSACSCQQKEKELEPSGVVASACSCQQKEDEKLKARVTPQGVGNAASEPPGAAVMQNAPSAMGLIQQACSCGGGGPPQLVFAIGALWFDFGTEARYDAFVQQLDPIRANNPVELIGFLRENPQYAAGITIILMQEQIPLYALQPAGPFAPQIYTAIFDALESSLDEQRNREQRVSVPGMIAGSTRLLNGMTIPVIYPDLRGMYKWQSHELIAAAKSAVGSSVAADDHIFNFLNRVYYELRNFGVAPQERALNFAATNAFQSQTAFAESAGRNLELDTIKVVKSPICRPDSDCWDVELQMFDPENERRANRVYRFTVDVSEILPVTVGSVRTWAVRA